MVFACITGIPVPKSLRFLSVGGAPVSPSLLLKAKDCGLPIFQGYGLSECASVVSLNSPDQNRVGSVGRVLPHLQVKISDQSEVFVKGPVFNGYLNKEKIEKEKFLATGDTGFIDEDNYLYITGRKKNQFITSFGRNVSPEWVEEKLTDNSVINKAFVYGEAKPWNTAIIFSTLDDGLKREKSITQAVNQANKKLPDYAQIKNWIDAGNINSAANKQLLGSGVFCRERILEAYKNQIDSLYQSEVCS